MSNVFSSSFILFSFSYLLLQEQENNVFFFVYIIFLFLFVVARIGMTRERWWKPEARPLYRCTRQDAPLRGLGGTKYYDYTDVLDKMHHRCTGGVGWDQVQYNDTKHQTRCTEMHPLPNRFTYLGCARNTTKGSFW